MPSWRVRKSLISLAANEVKPWRRERLTLGAFRDAAHWVRRRLRCGPGVDADSWRKARGGRLWPKLDIAPTFAPGEAAPSSMEHETVVMNGVTMAAVSRSHAALP